MYKVYREFEDMFGYDEVCMGEYRMEAEAEEADGFVVVRVQYV